MEYRTHLPDVLQSPIEYRITGTVVPALELMMDGRNDVYFEHFVLLYREPSVVFKMGLPRGAIKRMIGKMPVWMVRAKGTGRMALSRDGAGQIVGINVEAGQSLFVREHQFLAASGSMSYSFARIRGISNLLLGGTGFFVDRFNADSGPGVVWVHGYGNITEVWLDKDDMLDVEPGAWCYRDQTVGMSTVPVNLATGLLASTSFTLNRFRGPGRLGIQTMASQVVSSE